VSRHFAYSGDGTFFRFEEGGTDVHDEISARAFLIGIVEGVELASLRD
jgi:hypothetical protein